MLQSLDIKHALTEAGLHVYRASESEVSVAERVRENLIMDAGVSVRTNEPAVAFLTRARQTDFPNEERDALFKRAHMLGESATHRGYRETKRFVTAIPDPGDPSKTLDHWYEVRFEKSVENVKGVLAEVQFALSLAKTANR